MPTTFRNPALERLWLDVELERLRMRARFAGVNPDDQAAFQAWYLAGAQVEDEAAYLAHLERESDLIAS